MAVTGSKRNGKGDKKGGQSVNVSSLPLSSASFGGKGGGLRGRGLGGSPVR